GGLHEAARLAQEALAGSYHIWAGHIAMGAVHLCRYQWEEAKEAFDKALTLNSERTQIQSWYFFFLVIHGQVQDAIYHFKEATSRESVPASVRRNLALALMFAGDYAAAERELEQLLRHGPVHFLFHIYLAMVYHANGKHEEALGQVQLARVIPDSE